MNTQEELPAHLNPYLQPEIVHTQISQGQTLSALATAMNKSERQIVYLYNKHNHALGMPTATKFQILDEIIRVHALAGKTPKEIATRLDIPYSSVTAHLRSLRVGNYKADVLAQPAVVGLDSYRLNREQKSILHGKIIQAKADNPKASFAQIASQLGTTVHHVRRALSPELAPPSQRL